MVFAHPFPLNSRAAIASTNLIRDGKYMGCVIVGPHDEARPATRSCVIQDQRVGNFPVIFQSHPWAPNRKIVHN